MDKRPMRRLGVSRRRLFEAIERPVLGQPPATDYLYAEWQLARVGLDYHVEIESFFYSVPHALIRQQVDVCVTAYTIEVFHRGRRIATHTRALRWPASRHRSRVHAQCPSPWRPSPGGTLARLMGRLDA